MIPVSIPQNPAISMGQLKKLLQQVYTKSNKDKLNPAQVQHKLQDKDQQYTKLYTQLRKYMTSIKCAEVMKKAVADKVIKKVSLQLKIPLKQALCVVLLDDFWSSAKQLGHQTLNRMKNFYANNKQMIHDSIYGLASSLFPQAAPIISGVKAVFGGKLCSEDPYANDVSFIQCLYGGPPSPAPRKENHYMYQMNSRVQIPVTILPDGTTCVIVNPFSAVNGAFGSNLSYLPFIVQSTLNSNFPYNNTQSIVTTGPFNSQLANIINYGVDYCRISYVNTQAAIQCKGKLITSFFYQPPNNTFKRNVVTGLYNTGAVTITDSQLLQNTSYFRRKSNVQCQKLSVLGTLIPQQNSDQCIDVNQAANVNSQFYNTKLPLVVIKFTGCTASTTIGSLYVDIGISIQPTAAMRTIYSVTSRGSYQGTYRALKQSRKYGIPLQFLTHQQSQYLCHEHFSQIQFPVGFGQGRYIGLPGMMKLPQDQTGQGLCVRHSLQAIGILNDMKPYATISDALQITDRISYFVKDMFIFYSVIDRQQPLVYFNYSQRHATAIQFEDIEKFFTYCHQNNIVLLLKTQHGYVPYPVTEFTEFTPKIARTNNIRPVTRLSLLKAGVQRNPGPQSVQAVLRQISGIYNNEYDMRQIRLLILKQKVSDIVGHFPVSKLQHYMMYCYVYSSRYPVHQQVLRRIVRHCADRLNILKYANQKSYITNFDQQQQIQLPILQRKKATFDQTTQSPKILDWSPQRQYSLSQMDIIQSYICNNIDDMQIQLLKGGVQPNPGPDEDQPPPDVQPM